MSDATTKRPDAILVPRGLLAHLETNGLVGKYCNERFGDVLGVKQVLIRKIAIGDQNLITPIGDPDNSTLLHHTDHPTHPKQPRYTWEPQGDDGIKYGYLAEINKS